MKPLCFGRKQDRTGQVCCPLPEAAEQGAAAAQLWGAAGPRGSAHIHRRRGTSMDTDHGLLQSFFLQTGQAAGKIPFITDHHMDSTQGTAEFDVKTPAVPNLTAVHASRKKDRDYLHQHAWMEGANFTLPFV